MKQVKILIFISALALFFVQCTVKPSERSHNNAIGIWVGFNGDENLDKPGNWILGIDFKHLNSKRWNPNAKTNTAWNVYSGLHFGEHSGMNMDVSFNFLTNDLVSKTNGNTSQFYIGPSLGLNYLRDKGKLYKYSPKLGATGGMLMIIPEFDYFPESDITVEGSINYADKIIDKTKKEDLIGRFLYHVYVF